MQRDHLEKRKRKKVMHEERDYRYYVFKREKLAHGDSHVLVSPPPTEQK